MAGIKDVAAYSSMTCGQLTITTGGTAYQIDASEDDIRDLKVTNNTGVSVYYKEANDVSDTDGHEIPTGSIVSIPFKNLSSIYFTTASGDNGYIISYAYYKA